MTVTKKTEVKFQCPYIAKKMKAEVIHTADKIQILDPSKIMKPCPDGHRLSVYVNSNASKSDIAEAKNRKMNEHLEKKMQEFKKLPNTNSTWAEVHKKYIQWFSSKKGTKGFSDNTLEVYERDGRNYVYDTDLGKKSISDIDEFDLINFYDELHAIWLVKFNSAVLFLHISVVVKAVFEYAYDKRFITENPYTERVKSRANDLRIHIQDENPSTAKDIDVETVINFVDFVRDKSKSDPKFDTFADYLLVTLQLATRSAETCGIRIDDIDFANRQIHIKRQTVKHYGSSHAKSETALVTKSLKSKAGIRTIPLSDDLLNLFSKIDIDYREGILVPDKQGNKPIFPNGVPTYFRNLLETFLRRYGDEFEKKFGRAYEYVFHALRHAGISIWVRSGIDLYRVMKMAGHSSIQTTINIYGNPANKNDHFNMSELIKGVKNLTSDLLNNNQKQLN